MPKNRNRLFHDVLIDFQVLFVHIFTLVYPTKHLTVLSCPLWLGTLGGGAIMIRCASGTCKHRPSGYRTFSARVCSEEEMAAATISIEQDQFCCSVCLEVLRDPVTIPCGHSYCLDCIEDFWNRSQQRGQYTCPQCRQVFNPKPLLSRNTVLGEVVEKFLQSGSQSRHPAKVVKCSVCRTAAAKSCPVCVLSFCPAHLRAHDANFQGKRAHRLIPAMEDLKGHLCLHHHRLLTLYCRTDQDCVCSHCVKGRHKNHDAVSVEEQRAAQQVLWMCWPSLLTWKRHFN